MAKGDIYPSEIIARTDTRTGATVRQLTNYLCHSNHLYFTHWGYYGDGQWMLFHSDRGNAHNLFGINLETGDIRQLTDLAPGDTAPGVFSAVVSRTRDEAYFWIGNRLYALNLDDLRERPLWETPEGMRPGTPNCAADGSYLYFTLNEDLSARFTIDLLRGYVGFEETWAAKPLCQVWRIAVDGGRAEILWEENNWIGHVNSSPADPNLLTFCHEGPWDRVDNRIWGLDAATGKAWKIRPRIDGSFVGHEYWFEDGSRVGYHGANGDGKPFWGHADPLGDDRMDYLNTFGSMHFQSLDDNLIVGDGGRDHPYLMLWHRQEDKLEPRLLCKHGGSFRIQRVHVHPAIMPGGRSIIFTSDASDYGQIYTVELPVFQTLPEADR